MNPLLIKVLAGVALMAALYGGYKALTSHYVAEGRAEVHALWNADKAKIKAAEDAAVAKRNKENADLAVKQTTDSANITKEKYEELAPVVRTIYVDRVRVGKAICGGPTGAPDTKGTTSSDGADTGGRLVPQRIEEDIRALEVKVEEGFATGRACQSFVIKNGLM